MTPFHIPESVFLKLGVKCIACGSNRVISNGPNYKCKEKGCRKVFRKIPRRKRIPAEERPSCPDCGVGNPYSDSPIGWICRACGRNYTGESCKSKQVEVGANLEVQVE